MNFAESADFLIGKDYDRDSILRLIENERANKTFYDSREAIKAEYDNVRWDYDIRRC
jgi:hypothetical protein